MRQSKSRRAGGKTPQMLQPATPAQTARDTLPNFSIADPAGTAKPTLVGQSVPSGSACFYTGGLHASIYRPPLLEAFYWEKWWNRRPHTDFAAAYQRGRFLNQLNWYCQLAVLISFWEPAGHYREGVRTPSPHLQPIFDIKRHLRDLVRVPGDDRADLASRILKEFHRFLDYFISEDAKKRVHDVLQILSGQAKGNWTMRDDACVKLNDLMVKPFIDSLRSVLQTELADARRWAFRLGETVDAGVRRPDVCAFLNPPHFDPRFVNCPLVNFDPVAGSILPERSWSKEVLKLARRIGIDGVLKPLHDPSSPLQFTGTQKDEARPYIECMELAAMVRDLDKLVYAALGARKSEWFHQEHESPPAEYQYGPARGRLKEFAKWLDLDERTVKRKARGGIFWVRRLGRYEYEFWFRNESYQRLCAQDQKDAVE